MFNDLDVIDYFMLPRTLSNGLKIYPIKLKDYDRFNILATQYIVLDVEQRNNQLRQKYEEERKLKEFKELPYTTIFECLVGACNESIKLTEQVIKQIEQRNRTVRDIKDKYIKEYGEEQLGYMIAENPSLIDQFEMLPTSFKNETLENIYELLGMLFQSKIEFNGNSFEIKKDGLTIGFLNEDNFEEFRANVMEANLLFSPIIAPNLISQKFIDKQIKGRNKKSIETSYATMFSVVKATYKLSDVELMDLTYFRFRYDYSVCEILHFNEMNYIGGMFGGKSNVKNLCEKLKINSNPYDDLLSDKPLKGGLINKMK